MTVMEPAVKTACAMAVWTVRLTTCQMMKLRGLNRWSPSNYNVIGEGLRGVSWRFSGSEGGIGDCFTSALLVKEISFHEE